MQANRPIGEVFTPESEDELVNDLSFEMVEELLSIRSESSESDSKAYIECTNDTCTMQQNIPVTQKNTGEPSAKKSRTELSKLHFSVKSTLEKHPIGQAILKIGKFNKKLNTRYQSMLVDIIVCVLLSIPHYVTNDDLYAVAKQITLLFELECIETYYLPPVKKKYSRSNKSEVSKGKLPDKLRNLRTIIRDASHLEKEGTLCAKDNDYGEEELTIAKNSKIWLVHNRESTGVLKHWSSSYVLRHKDLNEKKHASLQDVLNDWPILKESRSFELIEKDFEKKFPLASSAFILEWDTFFKDLLKLYRKKITEQDLVYAHLLENEDIPLPSDGVTAIQFHLLSSLMAPKSNKTREKKKQNMKNHERLRFWKPSIAESREGFIIHVKIPGDIENRIYSKKAELLKRGLHLQPVVIAVGDDLTNITKSYVKFESITYELPSLLKAIDVLFKMYLVFNLTYPLECENFCYLIQWGIYKIKIDSDTQIPFVFNTLNNLKTEEK